MIPVLWFFWPPAPPHQRRCPPWGVPHLKLKPPSPQLKTKPPSPLKNKAPLQETIPRKSTRKIGNCHQYLCFTYKATLEKDGRNSTKTWFSDLKHSWFCKKSETVCLKTYFLINRTIDCNQHCTVNVVIL